MAVDQIVRTRSDVGAWAGDLTRPVPLIAAGVLAINDHVLKGAGLVPAAVTGKLSDVAGLLVAGIAAVALARGGATALTGTTPRRDGRLGVAALATVAAGFAALKLWPAFNHALAAAWGGNVLDASDLWALPMLALAFLWLRDREATAGTAAAPRRFAAGLALVAVLLVCAATPASLPPPPPPVVAWAVGDAPLAVPCGEVAAWVSKSGKTGVGLTVQVTARAEGGACPVAIVGATLRFAKDEIAGREIVLGPPAPGEVRGADDDGYARPPPPGPGSTTFHYVAFELDNQARWNRGERAATFALELELAGERRTWLVAATQAWVQLPGGAR